MIDDTQDTLIRAAAFKKVQDLQQNHLFLTSKELSPGFIFNGQRVPFVNPQRGIFKPKSMNFLLSVKTVIPRPGNRVWYDDQVLAHQQIFASEDLIDYSFQGENPEAADNRWLREAYENRVPIIYFLGVAPGSYEAILPVFISSWHREKLKVDLVFGLPNLDEITTSKTLTPNHLGCYPENSGERRYALQTVKKRLHQSSFREAIIHAYDGRCAVSGIPETLLLDAAHIVPDRHELFGQPIVQNGLPLSKIHHAAFDAHLLGIDPDYRIHISDRLLEKKDGPLLESLKGLRGKTIHLPKRLSDYPDQERLEMRFQNFRSAV